MYGPTVDDPSAVIDPFRFFKVVCGACPGCRGHDREARDDSHEQQRDAAPSYVLHIRPNSLCRLQNAVCDRGDGRDSAVAMG